MRLNNLSPSIGSTKNKKRKGRGIGSGLGKTCGRGHKGQKSRAGKKIRRGFEGGQTPLYRRLPKFGFKSRISQKTKEVKLSELSKINNSLITLDVLKSFNIIRKKTKFVKIMLSGNIKKQITLRGIRVSKGARLAIESLGGIIEECK
ncbi:50S ribosomal protein L15 [Sodalis-like secondary symbiont of Drepanosiphum platanoidis]|uniref:50S ribosomal protein L15 n=1 Tax=Sodalis-like secondary symbiont of Drepanosiphum platanoidis TaxID=2994493 RepID=UPI003463EE15